MPRVSLSNPMPNTLGTLYVAEKTNPDGFSWSISSRFSAQATSVIFSNPPHGAQWRRPAICRCVNAYPSPLHSASSTRVGRARY